MKPTSLIKKSLLLLCLKLTACVTPPIAEPVIVELPAKEVIISANLLVKKPVLQGVIPVDENGEATVRANALMSMMDTVDYKACAIDYNALVSAITPYLPQNDVPASDETDGKENASPEAS
jgi:hypothetical protein